MTLPATLPDAIALLGELVADSNLWLGMQTVGLILTVGFVVTWALLKVTVRR